jgi:hypothetical protein
MEGLGFRLADFNYGPDLTSTSSRTKSRRLCTHGVIFSVEDRDAHPNIAQRKIHLISAQLAQHTVYS